MASFRKTPFCGHLSTTATLRPSRLRKNLNFRMSYSETVRHLISCSVSECAHGDSLRFVRHDVALRGGVSGFDVRRNACSRGCALFYWREVPSGCEGLAGPGWVGCCVHSVCDGSLASYSTEDRERGPGLLYGYLV